MGDTGGQRGSATRAMVLRLTALSQSTKYISANLERVLCCPVKPSPLSRYFAATPVTVAVEHIPPALLEHGAPRPEHLVLTLAERSRVLALDAVKLAAD